jgi:hypothetical protein
LQARLALIENSDVMMFLRQDFSKFIAYFTGAGDKNFQTVITSVKIDV